MFPFNIQHRKAPATEKLFFATDIHCHVLPGIDDGAPTVEKGVSLVEAQRSWGLERIIATPHYTDGVFENSPSTIEPAMAALRQGLEEAGIDIFPDYSAELRIDDYSLSQIETGNVRPIAGDILLVENSFVQEPWGIDNTLFNLRVKGYRLIMAHPERYTYYHGNLSRYETLHNSGVAFQINLLSLAGHYGKRVRAIADMLIDRGLADYLGSDIHRAEHVQAIDRYLGSRDYRRDRRRLDTRLRNDRL